MGASFSTSRTSVVSGGGKVTIATLSSSLAGDVIAAAAGRVALRLQPDPDDLNLNGDATFVLPPLEGSTQVVVRSSISAEALNRVSSSASVAIQRRRRCTDLGTRIV